MSLSIAIACRRALPAAKDGERWSFELRWAEDDDTGADIYESARDEERDDELEARAGFRPASYVVIDPDWQASEPVAMAIAEAFDGVVIHEYDGEVVVPGRRRETPTTREDLEALVKAVFDEAIAEWVAGEKREADAAKAAFERVADEDPKGVAEANDWSDV